MEFQELTLTDDWDKIFPESDKVDHHKVTFPNRYGITLAADVYIPKNAQGKLPAIALSGPFGAVKEQASGLYAQKLAEKGYYTLATHLSQVKAAAFPAVSLRRISIPKISARLWIF